MNDAKSRLLDAARVRAAGLPAIEKKLSSVKELYSDDAVNGADIYALDAQFGRLMKTVQKKNVEFIEAQVAVGRYAKEKLEK